MRLIRYLFSKVFWLQFLLFLLLIILLGWGTIYWLRHFTYQNKEVQLPNMQTFSLEEVADTLEKLNLRFVVMDSSEYFPDFPRQSVIDHYPPAGAFIKPHRIINLTLNANGFRDVAIPDVIEKTRRRAIYDLESKGFVVGELNYVPYIGKDVVIGLEHKGRSIHLPASFPKGTRIDMTIGMGLSRERVRVPYLKGLKLHEAEEKIKSFTLNIGVLIWDDNINDSSAAFVYRQTPSPSWEPRLQMGDAIDLWLTNDENKSPLDSLDFHKSNPSIEKDSLSDTQYDDEFGLADDE